MKKLKLASLFLFLVGGIVSNAQKLSDNYDILLSKPYEVVDAKSKEYFSVKEGKYAITVKSEKGIATIQKFDLSTMEEVKKAEYEDFGKKSYPIETVKISEDKLYFIFAEYDKKTKSFIVKGREINIDNLALGSPIELTRTSKKVADNFGTVWYPGSMPVVSTGRMTEFKVDLSFDKSKLLLSYILVPEYVNNAKNHDVIGMTVLNTNDFSKLWDEEIEMPYTESQMNQYAYGVNNKGEAFILIRKNETKTYALLTAYGKQLKEDVLDIENELFFSSPLQINELPNGNLAFAGLYGNGVEFQMGIGSGTLQINVDGFYTFTLDQNHKILSENKEAFSIDFIKLYLNESQMKAIEKREADGKAGIQGLSLEEFIIDEEGNFILLMEQQYMKAEPYGMNFDAIVKHYSNVVLAKTDSHGKLIWMKKLPKNQVGLHEGTSYGSMDMGGMTTGYNMRGSKPVFTKGGGMSVKYMSDDNYHYVLYLDNAKNAELAVDEVPAAHRDGMGGFLTAYKVNDNTGEVEKDLLFDSKDFQGTEIYQFTVERIFNASNGVLLLEVYLKGKQDGMFQISAKE